MVYKCKLTLEYDLQCLKQMMPWMCITEDKKVAVLNNDNQSVITEKTEMTEIVKSESA